MDELDHGIDESAIRAIEFLCIGADYSNRYQILPIIF